ncbi:DUF982 domain-containing protein [Rhizobium sp. ERR 1071]|uniref:DUF982 domain-containing protein n=1 Tax=Rhizobium sp. ERR 1071 TaxID=2572677 RepID=UPI003FA68DD6
MPREAGGRRHQYGIFTYLGDASSHSLGWLLYQAINGPRGALRYLQNGFERHSGQRYWHAAYSCQTALRYRSAPEIARESFISACDNARTGASWVGSYAAFI